MRLTIAACLAACLCAAPGYGALPLALLQKTNIAALGFSSVGGMDFDDATGRLWLSDAGGAGTGGNNAIASIDPLVGTIFTSFSASVVPGLSAGPDALALHPGSGNLYAFSTFVETEAGVVTQSGVLVTDFGSNAAIDAGGAAFRSASELYIVDEANGALKTLDLSTGAVQTTTALTNFSGRLAAADFDPRTGRLIAYASSERTLLEIDVDTATVVSTTDVSSYLANPSYPTGLAFNADGSRLFLANGTDIGGDELLVFGVVPEPTSLALAMLGLLVAAKSSGRRIRTAGRRLPCR